MIQKLKSWVSENAPDHLYAIISTLYYIIHPSREGRIIFPLDDCWYVWSPDGKRYTLKYNTSRGTKEQNTKKFDRYTKSGFITVEPSDVVVDVGAYLGEVSTPASNIAGMVIAFEPDPRTYRCLEKNIGWKYNVRTENMCLLDEQKEVEFHMGIQHPSDSSAAAVDIGDSQATTVKADRLDSVLTRMEHNKVDFMKVDAEGLEPEVLAGSDGVEINKLAVDAGPERYGESTVAEVLDILDDEYETEVENGVVFGKRLASDL